MQESYEEVLKVLSLMDLQDKVNVYRGVVYQSNLHLWQVPVNVYSTMRVSLAQLQDKVESCGRIGEYLFRQMVDFNNIWADNPNWPPGESWAFWLHPLGARGG